jgi:isoquinoline 1-oxidoreductase alpha subunit
MASFKVNGKKISVEVPENMPLLWVLRDTLNLTGTKYGCGTGVCGSCKVLLDGSAVQSCSIPVSMAEGKEITTIEGENRVLQELQKAWAEFNVPQCGYCQPGQLIAATDLLLNSDNPSDTEIDEAMSGNICRCGTYQRVKSAIIQTVKNS